MRAVVACLLVAIGLLSSATEVSGERTSSSVQRASVYTYDAAASSTTSPATSRASESRVYDDRPDVSRHRVRASPGSLATKDVPEVVFSRSKAPEIAKNFDEAVENGAPTTLNRIESRSAIRANRREALRGQPAPRAGQSLDEYPFACTAQGGAGACVRAVPIAEQSYQGGVLSRFFQRHSIREGDPFGVRFEP